MRRCRKLPKSTRPVCPLCAGWEAPLLALPHEEAPGVPRRLEHGCPTSEWCAGRPGWPLAFRMTMLSGMIRSLERPTQLRLLDIMRTALDATADQTT